MTLVLLVLAKNPGRQNSQAELIGVCLGTQEVRILEICLRNAVQKRFLDYAACCGLCCLWWT